MISLKRDFLGGFESLRGLVEAGKLFGGEADPTLSPQSNGMPMYHFPAHSVVTA